MKTVKYSAYLMILTVIVSLGPTLLMGAANKQANQRVTGASEEGSQSDANDDGVLIKERIMTYGCSEY